MGYYSAVGCLLVFLSTVLTSSVQKGLKKLPLGITNIRQILTEDYIYVDKTGLIYDLMLQHDYDYFMVRPKGFGKTLLLSTLEEIFKGNKELFEDMDIYRTKYSWLKYPVLRFDFSRMNCHDPHKFEISLKKELKNMAKSHGVASVEGEGFRFQMRRLIEDLSKNGSFRVVVLVDEYDSPITNTLKDLKIAEKCRSILLHFIETLTSLSNDFLQFTFITGVNQFSICGSQGCGHDHLTDITLNPRYATMMGFTKEELETNFQDYVNGSQPLNEIRAQHNGYRFSESEDSVYSPQSTLSYLNAKQTTENVSYSFTEKIPSFLIDSMRNDPQIIFDLKNAATVGFPLKSPIDISKIINIEPFLFQTGYLTIRGYNVRDDWGYYELDFRNEDVKNAFFRSLLEGFTELHVDAVEVARDSEKIKRNLAELDLNSFISEMYIQISRIPIQLRRHATLQYYRAVFYLLLHNFGLETKIEYDYTRTEMFEVAALFQFTLNETGDTALERVEKLYKEKISRNKKTFCVGINFGLESHNIHDWKGVLYDGEETVQSFPSAGGLNEFEQFLANISLNNGR